MKNEKDKRSMKTITIFLALITLMVWVVLLLVKYLVWGLDINTLLDDIISNILGILPPIIIFNFLYEYLTKQHVADDTTEQITETLMSDPKTIALFSAETRTKFTNTTISTIVGEHYAAMVTDLLQPYITNRYNIRDFFKYTINLRHYNGSDLFRSEEYYRVFENLKMKKQCAPENVIPNVFHLGFFAENYDLDKELRSQTFLFRENLHIKPEQMQALVAMPHEEQFQFLKTTMELNVYIDNRKAQIIETTFTENGIDAVFHSDHTVSENNSIEVSFNMPQMRGHGEFLVYLSEPTYSPLIQFSYPEESMNVKAIAFLNDGDDSLVETANHYADGYEFYIHDKWIYPISGIVFVIDDLPEKTDIS